MKTLLFFIFLLPLVGNPNLDSIAKALNNGDVQTLSQYFGESVEIAVLDEEDIYDKAKAVQVVGDFFASNKPKSFNQVHQGTSKGKDSRYCIGNMVAGNASYRVYIYMKVTNGKYTIQELRFDKE